MEELNAGTQPLRRHPVFNNWDVLPRAWYFALPGHELPRGAARTIEIGTQRVTVFRGESGAVHALDAFCPHMGTDLGIGRVRGDTLRCYFHHWRFDGGGRCVDIPCQLTIPAQARVRAYATAERYGFIWVYPDTIPDVQLLEIPGLEGKDVVWSIPGPNRAASHHHVSMINGLDAQHLATVHGVRMAMTVTVAEDERHVDFALEGDTPDGTLVERLVRVLVGPRYGYAMRYAQASVAALVLMRDVRFFRWRWPELYMIFAYRPLRERASTTQPIFVAERRPGLRGWLRARALIGMTRLAYRFLKAEDDRVYDNIRFNTGLFLPLDSPVVRYVSYVDGLTPSCWSRLHSPPGEEDRVAASPAPPATLAGGAANGRGQPDPRAGPW